MKIDSRKLRALMASQGHTQTMLADLAGVSRQTLQAILKKDSPEVRSETLRGLVRALRLPDESALQEDALAGYKAVVAAEHACLDFRGLGLPATEPRPLDDLFVPARVHRVLDPNSNKACDLARTGNGAEIAQTSLTTEEDVSELALAQCLARWSRLLLRGDPGSGKTTALRHLARSYAEGIQAEAGYPKGPLTPIFVRLAEYAKAR